MMNGKNIAYVRVSSITQNEERQIEGLKKYNIDKWFCEKVSGKNTDRPELQNMLEYIREGDVIYILEFSRLGRSTADLLDIVNQIESKGAKLVSDHEQFDTSTPAGRLQMTMLAAISQFERDLIRERQQEGIEIAKKKGVYKGRKPVKIDGIEEYYAQYMRHEISKSEIARREGCSWNTVDKLFKELK